MSAANAAQAVEAFAERMAAHGIVTLVSGGEAVHLDRKLDDADNYAEMVNRLAKDYIDWWMLSKARPHCICSANPKNA